jgi:hypothetical protein
MDERKIFSASVDRLVLKTMADQSPKAQYQAAKPRSNALRSRRGDRSTKEIL